MIIKNFLFHRVSTDPDAMWPPMKPDLFSKIIRYLVKNYNVVPLEHFLDDLQLFQEGKKVVTVLFDDGFKDNIQFAVPILRKYKCPASFYIVTDCIDRNIPTWTYLTDHALQLSKKRKLELNYDFVPPKFKIIPLQIIGKSNPILKEIKPWMKSLPDPLRLKITQSILEQCDDVEKPSGMMMNWDDIRQLNSEGFIIGSHSHSHPLLASLQNESEISEELRTSSRRIYQETGKTPQTISYPIGSFDERVIRLSKNEGYKYGLAVEQKYFNYSSDLMTIPRVELYQEPWWKVRLHLTGNYWNRLKRIRN